MPGFLDAAGFRPPSLIGQTNVAFDLKESLGIPINTVFGAQ